MQIHLDTDRFEDIKIILSDEEISEGLADTIQDFCYGIASLFVVFAHKINCHTKQARTLQKVFLSSTDRFITSILDKGLLAPEAQQPLEGDPVRK